MREIDEQFYHMWIDQQTHRKFTNLVNYLLPQTQWARKQSEYNQHDYLTTEKTITQCRLLDQLLEIIGLDLKSHLFTGMEPIQLSIDDCGPHQFLFIKQNKKDLLYQFGSVARIRGKIETAYQLNKYVSRILMAHFGILFSCQRIRVRNEKEREYEAEYSLAIDPQMYELLSYRVLSHWQKHLRWLFSNALCRQLKEKYNLIELRWNHLAVCTEWPDAPEIASHKPKLILKPTRSIDHQQTPQPSDMIKPRINIKIKRSTDIPEQPPSHSNNNPKPPPDDQDSDQLMFGGCML